MNQVNMSQRIGFFGGTFDPIHKGHLAIAQFVLDALALDELQLIPNHVPPHKSGPDVSAQHRLEMVRLATKKQPNFRVNALELEQDSPSYSIYTLQKLRACYPNDALFFMMGMDSFAKLSLWHKWDELLHHVNLVICQRPGDLLPSQGKEAQLWQQHQAPVTTTELAGQIICLQNPNYDISSTQIRTALLQQQDTSALLTPEVLAFIHSQQLYR